MISPVLILSLAFGYLLLLFGIAFYADKRAEKGKSLIDNPYVYSLSLAVYCTAWTFYGSVGRAAETGLGFLPIYIGPTLMAILWFIILQKIIRIAKYQRITSIADFIGSRYGKSTFLAGLVSIIAVFGIIPYISLQLKAISSSYLILVGYGSEIQAATTASGSFFTDTAFYIALVLGLFTILFGTRTLDASEKHEGMVAAIAFESIIKLFAFIAAGLFVVFVMYDSPFELFKEAYSNPKTREVLDLAGDDVLMNDWIWLTLLSMPAILLLPRQFQTAVVENVRIGHVRSAAWMFPLYLFIINLFVLPIAMAGLLHPTAGMFDADTFVLTIPLIEGQIGLTLLVFIGGLSAATSMVIVAAIALSTMISNDLVMPALLRSPAIKLLQTRSAGPVILGIRRVSILLILLFAYLYFRFIGEEYTLVSIGLVSFAAVAQFAPALFAGLYWSGATRAGAIAGIIGGTFIWAYTLVIPSIAGLTPHIQELVNSGPFGLTLLKPSQLFGIAGMSPVAQSFFWSMLVNILLFFGVSLMSRQSALEISQAALFVEGKSVEEARDIQQERSVTTATMRTLLHRFLGKKRAVNAIGMYENDQEKLPLGKSKAPQSFIRFVENQLAGAIGSASARLLMASEVSEKPMTTDEVRHILDETRQVLEYSRMLEEKSLKLEQATLELRKANEQLRQLDEMKDEFVATVTHELKTPLTSIRALTEILIDTPDISHEKKEHFLGIIARETERLTRLINQLLDTQKFNSGAVKLDITRVQPQEIIDKALQSMKQVFEDEDITLEAKVSDSLPEIKIDEDRITQVLLNLLSNAVKFCKDENGWILLNAEVQNGFLNITVKDNGAGISLADADRIFQPFVQASDSGVKKPGTGLGLSISRKIMEAHGGSLILENPGEDGAAFSAKIPV